MKLIRIHEAARLLGVNAHTLRRRSEGKDWVELYGHRIRVYRMDLRPDAERRFDADEIQRVIARLEKSRPT